MPRSRTDGRGGTRCRRLGLHVEPLERRLVAAGDVSARLVGSTLFLFGDGAANRINVASVAGGGAAVLGADTTVNGSATPFVTATRVRNVVADLRGGDDVVAFSNNSRGVARLVAFLEGSPFGSVSPVVPQAQIDAVAGGVSRFTVTGYLTLATGAGNDTVAIVGAVGGDVVANLGAATGTSARTGNLFGIGWDEEFDQGDLLQSRVGGSLIVTGGAQADGLGLFAVDVGRSVVAALGAGTNSCDFVFAMIEGDLAVTGGGGNDLFLLRSSVVRNALSVALGGGGDDVVISDTVSLVRTVIGSVTIATGSGTDFVTLGDFDVRRDVRIAGGPGADTVRAGVGAGIVMGGTLAVLGGADDDLLSVKADIGGGLRIVAGSGDDMLNISGSTIRGAAVIDALGGDDTVTIGSTEVGGVLTCRLGSGDDSLALQLVRALAMWLYGGPGTNVLSLQADAPRGIRWFQFQVVTG